jgi:2-polyprenyl-3-methyl-5-hydroxy-6-metoxy-1,4-benzoquinol methylase
MMERTSRDAPPLATEDVPSCPVCARPGTVIYDRLPDRLYHTPGLWRFRRCEDTGCGTYWMDPRPTPSDIGRAYESFCTHLAEPAGGSLAGRLLALLRREYLAHRYGYGTGTLPRALGKALAALTYLVPGPRAAFDLEVRRLGPRPGARLLDVGSGGGHDMDLLQQLGWQVEGVEFDPKAAAVARARGLLVHAGTLEQQSFPDEQFDVVSLSHVVEHLHDPLATLRECRRVLKTGGDLVVATPNARGLTHRKYGEHWYALDPPRHLMLFTQASLKALVQQAGLRAPATRTTVRDELMLDVSSRSIRDTGRWQWGQPPSLASAVSSHLVQYLAPVQVALGRREGDEIFLTARK